MPQKIDDGLEEVSVAWKATAHDGTQSSGCDKFMCAGDSKNEQREYLRRRGYRDIEILYSKKLNIIQ